MNSGLYHHLVPNLAQIMYCRCSLLPQSMFLKSINQRNPQKLCGKKRTVLLQRT